MNKDKDMHLPAWVLGLGIFFLALALACVVLTFTVSAGFLIGAAGSAGLGVAAVLCWKNQWAVMVDHDSFEYSTMFGEKTLYYFADITELKRNSDSFSLFCGDGKIHIESCAILSDRFIDAVDAVLAKKSLKNRLAVYRLIRMGIPRSYK